MSCALDQITTLKKKKKRNPFSWVSGIVEEDFRFGEGRRKEERKE